MPIINRGTCKPEQVHGSRKRAGPVYIRTPGTTIEAIADQVTVTSVKAVYDSMITSLDIDDAPRDERVVRNKKYNGKKDERQAVGLHSHARRDHRATFTVSHGAA